MRMLLRVGCRSPVMSPHGVTVGSQYSPRWQSCMIRDTTWSANSTFPHLSEGKWEPSSSQAESAKSEYLSIYLQWERNISSYYTHAIWALTSLLCTCYMVSLSRLGYGSSFKMIWRLAVLRMMCRSLTSDQLSLTHPSPLYPYISPLEWKSLFLGQGAPAPLNVWREKHGMSLCSSISHFFFFNRRAAPFPSEIF